MLQYLNNLRINFMDLSDILDEIREIEIYGSEPSDWMGYLGSDDYWVPDEELAY